MRGGSLTLNLISLSIHLYASSLLIPFARPWPSGACHRHGVQYGTSIKRNRCRFWCFCTDCSETQEGPSCPVLTIALPDTLVNPYDQFSLNETVDALRQKLRAYAIRTVIFSAAEVLDALCIRGWAKKWFQWVDVYGYYGALKPN